MTHREAIETLRYFNYWRRSEDPYGALKQPDPTKLGKAIDYAIKHLENENIDA